MIFIKFFFVLLIISFVYNGVRTYFLFQKTLALEILNPYEQNPSYSKFKILVIGDSTAIGTGSRTNTESTAGRLGAMYPDAEVINKGINGQKIKQLTEEFDSNNFPNVDLLVIQIGANDIVQFTRLSLARLNLDILLDKATKISPRVVILHGGNVGNAPFFPSYLGFIWDKRTRDFRDLYIEEANKYNVAYVDLYQDREHDIFLTDPNKYYASDKFHPSGDGYKVWFDAIIDSLKIKYGAIGL